MDIEKTCLDQATFEVGAHNVRDGGSQAKTHKKYNIPLWVKTKKENIVHTNQLQSFLNRSLAFRQKEGSSTLYPPTPQVYIETAHV